MSGAYSMYGRQERAYSVLVEKPERNRLLGRPRRIWEIILKWILKKQDGKMWRGFN
jgi:hypothetical protein